MNDKSAGEPDRLTPGLGFDSVQPDNGLLQCHAGIYHSPSNVIPAQGKIMSQGAGLSLDQQ